MDNKSRSSSTSLLDSTLNAASRRHRIGFSLEAIAIAAAAGAAGLILLLLAGTQILDWYWPAALFVFALAFSMWRLRKRELSRYAVAQMLDERLGLEDRLSTLVWFREHDKGAATAVLGTVEQQALSRLRDGDVQRAIPLRFPRYGYAGVALAAAAVGLFGLRYMVLNTVELDKPIARLDLSIFEPAPKQQPVAANKKSIIQERLEQQLKELGMPIEDLPGPEGTALRPEEISIPGAGEEAGSTPTKGSSEKQPSPEGMESGENAGEQTSESGDDAGEGEAKAGTPKNQAPPKDGAKPGQGNSNSSLMNKMRDALANLMNKMKMPPQDGQNGQDQQSNDSKQAQNGPQPNQGKSQAQGKGQQSQNGEQDAQQEGEQVASDNTRSGEKNADKSGGENSKSGRGRSEGDKSIRDAEQLAALGKLSEILGKRSQQLTGEMTVEVSSGKQQLKTAWTERSASHSDTGGEVNRDEIPLAYQTYVQRYFQSLRKAAPPKTSAKTGSD